MFNIVLNFRRAARRCCCQRKTEAFFVFRWRRGVLRAHPNCRAGSSMATRPNQRHSSKVRGRPSRNRPFRSSTLAKSPKLKVGARKSTDPSTTCTSGGRSGSGPSFVPFSSRPSPLPGTDILAAFYTRRLPTKQIVFDPFMGSGTTRRRSFSNSASGPSARTSTPSAISSSGERSWRALPVQDLARVRGDGRATQPPHCDVSTRHGWAPVFSPMTWGPRCSIISG